MKKYEGNRNMQVAQPCSDPLSSYKASYLGPTIPFIYKNLVDQFRLHFELTTECREMRVERFRDSHRITVL